MVTLNLINLMDEQIGQLITDLLNPELKLDYATEYAWDDIWSVVEDIDYVRDDDGRVIDKVVRGYRLLRVQVKGTYYSKKQIQDNKTYLEVEPHKAVNDRIRAEMDKAYWSVLERVPEKVVSGTLTEVRNPNA